MREIIHLIAGNSVMGDRSVHVKNSREAHPFLTWCIREPVCFTCEFLGLHILVPWASQVHPAPFTCMCIQSHFMQWLSISRFPSEKLSEASRKILYELRIRKPEQNNSRIVKRFMRSFPKYTFMLFNPGNSKIFYQRWIPEGRFAPSIFLSINSKRMSLSYMFAGHL